MKRILFLSLSLLTAACATRPGDTGSEWAYQIERPPIQYRTQEPTLPVRRIDVDYANITNVCRGLVASNAGRDISACTLLGKTECLIFITKEAPKFGITLDVIAVLFEHEKYGHCNGLVHDDDGHGWYDGLALDFLHKLNS